MREGDVDDLVRGDVDRHIIIITTINS